MFRVVVFGDEETLIAAGECCAIVFRQMPGLLFFAVREQEWTKQVSGVLEDYACYFAVCVRL